jgi:hypothetical protein
VKQYHEAANLFPMMSETEFSDLVESVAANGLREPIWLHTDGSIIDGRNRYEACLRVGIEPDYRVFEGPDDSLVKFVLDLNLHRRHLNESQRAMVAAKISNLGEGRPRNTSSIEPVSQSAAAAAVNVGRESVKRAAQVRDFGSEEMKHDVESGNLAVSRAAAIIKEADKDPEKVAELYTERKHNVHFTSDSPEWYTPSAVVDATLRLLGHIDLDPCSDPDHGIPATTHYTQKDDGLAQAWAGTVYMNPPYGGVIGGWVEKLIAEYRAGNVTEAVALVPSRTDTRWFAPLYEFSLCFVSGRLKFSGHENSAPFPSVLVYLGERREEFKDIFSDLGPSGTLQ